MKNLIKARNLKRKIKSINQRAHPNTFIRLNAACEALEGFTLKEIADRWEVCDASVLRWKNRYLDKQSIDDFKEMEKIELNPNPRDTSNDAMYANRLRQELVNFDKEHYPNTFIRLNAACEALEGSTAVKTGKKWNVHETSVLEWRNWYIDGKSIQNFMDIESRNVKDRDTSNDAIYANKLQQELINFDEENYPNTFKRLNAICEVLEGRTLQEAADKWGGNDSSVYQWKKLYLEDLSIEKIKAMENREINLRDTSLDEIYADRLEQELRNLDKKRYPNTEKRANAILLVFKEQKLLKDAGKSDEIGETAVRNYIKIYIEKDMAGLIDMEDQSLSRSRDASVNEKLIADYKKALENLDEQANPLGKKQAETILKVLNKDITKKEAAKEYNLSGVKTIERWIKLSETLGVDAFLAKVQKSHKNREMVSENAISSEELASSLESDLEKLSTANQPRTHERATILLSVLKKDKDIKDAARDNNILVRTITDWKNIYKQKDIDGLIAFENVPIHKKKKSNSKKKKKTNATNVARLSSSTNDQETDNLSFSDTNDNQTSTKGNYKTTGLDDDPTINSEQGDYIGASWVDQDLSQPISTTYLSALAKQPKRTIGSNQRSKSKGPLKKRKIGSHVKIYAV